MCLFNSAFFDQICKKKPIDLAAALKTTLIQMKENQDCSQEKKIHGCQSELRKMREKKPGKWVQQHEVKILHKK